MSKKKGLAIAAVGCGCLGLPLAALAMGGLVYGFFAIGGADAEMPEVAAMMAGVALDEVRHAELSRALHAWLWERLDDGARARLMAAHARAWAETREAVYATREDHRTRALGLPTGQTARQMVDVLCRETLAAA